MGAAAGIACTFWRIAPAATGPGWAVLAVVTGGWVATVTLTLLMATRSAVRDAKPARISLWLAVMCGAYGRVVMSNLYGVAGISSLTERPAPWLSNLHTITEEAAAITAMCGVWVVVITGSIRDPRGPYRSQHARFWPVWPRILVLWLIFEFVALVVARWLLVETQVLPMGVGPFHDDADWSDWVRRLLAGPYEELGFTGLTALLLIIPASGRTPSRVRLCSGIVVATILRAIPHLYYGQGELTSDTILPIPSHLASALNQWVWCLIWAGAATWMFVHYRRIWPIVTAHSLWNVLLSPAFFALPVLWVAVMIMLRWAPDCRWSRSLKAVGRDIERHHDRYAHKLCQRRRRRPGHITRLNR